MRFMIRFLIFSFMLMPFPALSSEALLEDDFDDGVVDVGKWEAYGNSVYERNGILEAWTDVTDDGGGVYSVWLDFDPEKPVEVKRDIYLHPGNNRFIGRLQVLVEGATGFTFGVSHANMDYFSETWVEKKGTYLFRSGGGGHKNTSLANQSESIEAVWDQWFTEKLVYDPGTGMLRYYIDNELRLEYDVGLIPELETYRMRVDTEPWGWYTGHYQYMDNFSISASASAPDDTVPVVDSDGDGVIDAWDKCAETPAGSFVDKTGCPGGAECTEAELNEKYEQGYQAGLTQGGSEECPPPAEGTCATYDFIVNTLHIPCLSAGTGPTYWLDLKMISNDPVQLELEKSGINDIE